MLLACVLALAPVTYATVWRHSRSEREALHQVQIEPPLTQFFPQRLVGSFTCSSTLKASLLASTPRFVIRTVVTDRSQQQNILFVNRMRKLKSDAARPEFAFVLARSNVSGSSRCRRDHPPDIAMRLTSSLAEAVFGSLTVNTSFLNEAVTLSSSISSTGIRRSKRP